VKKSTTRPDLAPALLAVPLVYGSAAQRDLGPLATIFPQALTPQRRASLQRAPLVLPAAQRVGRGRGKGTLVRSTCQLIWIPKLWPSPAIVAMVTAKAQNPMLGSMAVIEDSFTLSTSTPRMNASTITQGRTACSGRNSIAERCTAEPSRSGSRIQIATTASITVASGVAHQRAARQRNERVRVGPRRVQAVPLSGRRGK